MQCIAFVRLYLSTDEKFHFVPPLHSTHQVSPREGASVTAHIGYQVKHIAFKPQNHLLDKLRVLQKPPPSLWTATTNGMDCNLSRSGKAYHPAQGLPVGLLEWD